MNDGFEAGAACNENSGVARRTARRIANGTHNKSGSQLRLQADGGKKQHHCENRQSAVELQARVNSEEPQSG
jgi:hypothetical protein